MAPPGGSQLDGHALFRYPHAADVPDLLGVYVRLGGMHGDQRLRANRANDVQKIGAGLVAGGQEGFVVRSTYPFYYGQFGENVAKYVRPNHVTTDVHWSKQPIVKNEVKFK